MTARIDRRAVMLGGPAAFLLVSAAPPRPMRAPVRLFDALLTDIRAGREVRLISDVIRNRAVAVSFFFTGCSTICPIQSSVLTRTQALLAKEMGRRVAFVSISIDPFGDTPAAIRRFAGAHSAGPNWHFLKASVSTTDAIRRGFDAFASTRNDHPPVLAIGRAGTSAWSRLYGLPQPRAVADELRRWLA